MAGAGGTVQSVASLLAGSKVSSLARRCAQSASRSLSENERAAILSRPSDARRHAWVVTSPHMQRLRTNAYSISVFDDDDIACAKDSLDLRGWVSNTFNCSTPALLPGSTAPRETFACWRVFKERQHAKFIYLPRKVIRAGMAASGFPPHAGDGALVSASSNDSLATHTELARMQSAIRACVRNADVIDPSLSEDMDTGFLDKVQVDITKNIVASPFSALTGGAGTGKTALIAVIVAAFLRCGVPVLCLAPTHRAKKNLAKRLPGAAHVCTVDSFVKQSGSANSSPEARFIFVDEASMLSLEKSARLARAVMQSKRWQICFAGDDGQLEPIERGEIFRTILHNGQKRVFRLTKCYRAKHTDLFDAQVSIRSGDLPASTESFTCTLLKSDGDVETAIEAYVQVHGAKVQYIAWTNRMCDIVNQLVQRKVQNKSCTGSPMVGDRVIFSGRNDTKRNLTNAMTGEVVSIGRKCVSVDWEDGAGTMDCATSDASLAYCVTVHKAQGSEMDHVCVIATNVAGMTKSLDRRWLYTAVSRAKSKCDVFSTHKLLSFAAMPMKPRQMVGISFA